MCANRSAYKQLTLRQECITVILLYFALFKNLCSGVILVESVLSNVT